MNERPLTMKSDPESRPAGAAPEDAPQAGEPRQWLSALADGEADATQQACALWRGDADARRTWHAYHLIGDVLRSEELARAPTRDAAFVDGLRERLAQEPVLLAPAPPQREHRGQRWLVPAAAAAGFVAVAGVLVVLRSSSPDGQAGGPVLATASRPGAVLVSADAVPATAGGAAVAGGVLLRDRRLDEFLRAHQAERSGVAVAAPGGALRQVEVVVPVGAAR